MARPFSAPEFVFDPKGPQRPFDDLDDVVLVAHLREQDVAGADLVLLALALDPGAALVDQPVLVGVVEMVLQLRRVVDHPPPKIAPLEPFRCLSRRANHGHRRLLLERLGVPTPRRRGRGHDRPRNWRGSAVRSARRQSSPGYPRWTRS